MRWAPLVLLLLVSASACRPPIAERRSDADRPDRRDLRSGERPAAFAFDPPELDFGTVLPEAGLTSTVSLRNLTDRSVTVQRLDVPCDCTTAELRLPHELGPGQALPIPITLDLREVDRGGRQAPGADGAREIERSLTALAADGSFATLPIRCRVTDLVEVAPARLDFGPIPVGSGGSENVLIQAGSAGRAVAVTAARCAAPDCTVEIQESRTEGTRVLLVWGPFESVGPQRAAVELDLDLTELPRITLPLTAEAVPVVVARPERIDVDGVAPTRPYVATVSVSRPDGFPLEIRSVRSSGPRVRAEVLTGGSPSGSIRLVRVIVPVLPPPREVSEDVIVVTDASPGGTLIVPVRVRGRPGG